MQLEESKKQNAVLKASLEESEGEAEALLMMSDSQLAHEKELQDEISTKQAQIADLTTRISSIEVDLKNGKFEKEDNSILIKEVFYSIYTRTQI